VLVPVEVPTDGVLAKPDPPGFAAPPDPAVEPEDCGRTINAGSAPNDRGATMRTLAGAGFGSVAT
jgi:hypothetical protein